MFKKFYGAFAGRLWIPVSDFITDSIRRRVFQFADEKRPVTGKLADDGNRGNHPVFFFFPQSIQKCDGICGDMGSGDGGKPTIVPELEVIIPA